VIKCSLTRRREEFQEGGYLFSPLLAASFSPFWAVPERGCHRGMSGYKTNKYILLYESRETAEEKSLSIPSLLKQRVSLNLSYYDI
jgi:hypothetical protein